MSKRITTSYNIEFRKSSAKLAIDSDQPVYKTAENLGVNQTTLAGWIRKYYPKKEREPVKSTDTNEELIRLRQENARLTQERDILKKAAAYFASEAQ
jgi:transposase-like protein